MKILFIQTGGTIDKDYPRTSGGYAFEITGPAVIRILENAGPVFDYEVLDLMRKDSLDMTADDRRLLRETCMDSGMEKIIITHGTDTMIETAEALSDIPGKTIILTGAMRPERFTNSDAAFNIGVAVGALDTAPAGVYIAMNGRLYAHKGVKRDPATGRFIDIHL